MGRNCSTPVSASPPLPSQRNILHSPLPPQTSPTLIPYPYLGPSGGPPSNQPPSTYLMAIPSHKVREAHTSFSPAIFRPQASSLNFIIAARAV